MQRKQRKRMINFGGLLAFVYINFDFLASIIYIYITANNAIYRL